MYNTWRVYQLHYVRTENGYCDYIYDCITGDRTKYSKDDGKCIEKKNMWKKMGL